jgi:hypothetical protein
MAPYKLEDNIREKLEAREMKPSVNAWKKLEAKLDAERPKKKTVLWYYVAASFVGLLILASVLFNRNTSEVKNQVVNENSETPATETELEIIPNNSNNETIASEENSSEKMENKASKKKASETQKPNVEPKPFQQKKSAIDKRIEKRDAIAVQNSDVEQTVNTEKTVLSKEDQIFNTKVDEVVASVKKLQQDNAEVTATEVEALLDNARHEIQTQRILNSEKVDATALLQDVEWELEKSFRDKVFDALGEGFQKVRTAVSERND